MLWKGRTGSVRNSTLHPLGPGYRSNFQSSQAEAVIKPRGSVEGETGHLFTPLNQTLPDLYITNTQFAASALRIDLKTAALYSAAQALGYSGVIHICCVDLGLRIFFFALS